MGIRRVEPGEKWWLPPEAADPPLVPIAAPAVTLAPEESYALMVGPALPLCSRSRTPAPLEDRWQ